MEPTLQEQTQVFLYAMLIGVLLAGSYTVFGMLRTASPPGKILLFVYDLLFTGIGALINFLFALSQTHGRIRGYVLLAELLTFVPLYLTVGRLLRHSTDWLCRIVSAAAAWLTAPFQRFSQSLAEAAKAKGRFLLKKIKKQRNSSCKIRK